jgi:hypothetical protein
MLFAPWLRLYTRNMKVKFEAIRADIDCCQHHNTVVLPTETEPMAPLWLHPDPFRWQTQETQCPSQEYNLDPPIHYPSICRCFGTQINDDILIYLSFLIVLFYLAVSRGFYLWISQTMGRTPWTDDRPDARPLPTQDNTTHRNADTHPCPEQDSNLWSQHPSDRRQCLPETARLLRPAY